MDETEALAQADLEFDNKSYNVKESLFEDEDIN